MGDVRVTVQNLTIVKTDNERGLVMVKGAVPGAKGGWILLQDAVKHPMPKDAPLPASIRGAGGDETPPEEEAPAEEVEATEAATEETPAEAEATDETPAEEDTAAEEETKETE